MNNVFKSNQFSIFTQQARLICKSLYEKFNIKVFNYIRVNEDGGTSYLCSNNSWLEHYITNKYPLIGAFEQNQNLLKYKYVLWSGLSKVDQILIDNREIHKIFYGITFIRHSGRLKEFYNIGFATRDRTILNEIINNLSIFEAFLDEFHEKGKNLIQSSNLHQIYFPNQNLPSSSLDTNRYIIQNRLGLENINLTNREIDCLELAIEGKTAYIISKFLGCSRRTVETHLNNIKKKLNCNKMISLGYTVAKLKIDERWSE